ncbi:MAG: T9SS type A sorting domain-containing protein, partial [Bacteroidetes bacterium]|nr:T9SS type A sorting domain-containing protein [Bacteroidota bacterium]
VTLVASGAPDGGSYQWFDEVGDLVGTDAEFVAQGVVQNTIYTVQSISATGCVSTLKEVVAGFREAISKPVIERDQDILHTSTQADSYQWFRDGEPIEGERGSSLLHTDLGAYQVEVEINGCSNISETFVVTAISDLIYGELINLYPNPANNFIRILIENLTAKKYTLLVFEISGKIVFHEELTITTGKLDKELDINKYDNGVYFVKLTDGEYVYTGKFVKR